MGDLELRKTLKKRSSQVGDEHFVSTELGWGVGFYENWGLPAICLGKSSEIKFADKRLFAKIRKEYGGGNFCQGISKLK